MESSLEELHLLYRSGNCLSRRCSWWHNALCVKPRSSFCTSLWQLFQQITQKVQILYIFAIHYILCSLVTLPVAPSPLPLSLEDTCRRNMTAVTLCTYNAGSLSTRLQGVTSQETSVLHRLQNTKTRQQM